MKLKTNYDTKNLAVKASDSEFQKALIEGKSYNLTVLGIPRTGYLYSDTFYFTERKKNRLKVKL